MLDYILATLGFLASVVTIIGFLSAIIRNFKTDVNAHIDRLEKRIDSLDERMFYLSTGKTLSQAILDEKMKEKK